MISKRCLKNSVTTTALIIIASMLGCVSTQPGLDIGTSVEVNADHPHIQYSGRSEGIGTSKVSFSYGGSRVRFRFTGSSIGMWMDDDGDENHVMVWIDGKPGEKFRLSSDDGFYTLANNLGKGEHTIEVVRVTECFMGLVHFRGFKLDGDAKVLEWESVHDRKIEFIGDSITCAYGVEVDDPNLHFDPATENFCLGYSGLTARNLDADYLVISRSGIGMVRNWDGPYEGNEDSMPNVYPYTFYLEPDKEWDFSRFTPDVVCLNLGTNDFSTTGVNVEKFVSAYIKFGSILLERYPETDLVMLQGPMNVSDELKSALTRVVDQLRIYAPERVNYFELSQQGSVGMGADSHPNRAQSKINAAELTAYLSELMDWH